MVDETLDDALSFPLRGDDAVRRVVLGSVLALLSVVLVVPGVLLAGYAVAACRSVLAGDREPPALGDWRTLARDGLDVAGIAILYAVPGLVVAALSMAVPVLASMGPGGGGGGMVAALLTVVFGFGGSAVASVYGVAVAYVLPAALVNYARTGTVSAAWDRSTLREVLLDGDYVATWMAGLLVAVAAASLGGATAAAMVGFPVLFYGLVAATALFTRGSMDALGLEPPGDTGATAGEGTDEAGTDEVDEPADPLLALPGVDESTAAALRAAGFESPEAVRSATRSDLATADGVGPPTADRVKQAAEERA
jgi:hypothetical protein